MQPAQQRLHKQARGICIWFCSVGLYLGPDQWFAIVRAQIRINPTGLAARASVAEL